MKEVEEMMKNPSKYKTYTDVDERIADLLSDDEEEDGENP